MSLAEVLEEAASELSQHADAIRPANGDPLQLLAALDTAAAAEVLVFVLGRDAQAGEELALDWSEDSRGIDPILTLDESALPKVGRKVLRRVRHRMRSRGIAAPAAPPSTPRVARLPEISDEIDSAHLCRVDAGGSYLVFLIEPHPTRGARLFRIALDEARGILDFEVYSASRGKLRDFVKELHGTRGGAVEADVAGIRCLVARLAEVHPADRVLPGAFSEWRRKLVQDAGEETPGEEVQRVLSPSDDADAGTRVAARIRASELGPWPPAKDVLKQVGEQLEASLDKLEAEEPAVRRAAVEAALAAAIEGSFDDRHRARTGRRLLQAAYVEWKSGHEALSRDCLAAAASFCDAECRQNVVARALVEACYSPVLERASGAESAHENDRVES